MVREAKRRRWTALSKFHNSGADDMLTGSCHCGNIGWTFDGMPDSVTACNCTLCRRYGVLWIYDYEDARIKLSGTSTAYTRSDRTEPALEIHFCGRCGCVTCWRSLRLEADGRRRMAVNVRLTDPALIAQLPIDHFDGLSTFDDLPRDGRCVSDLWF
jgi:hypothetical protein